MTLDKNMRLEEVSSILQHFLRTSDTIFCDVAFLSTLCGALMRGSSPPHGCQPMGLSLLYPLNAEHPAKEQHLPFLKNFVWLASGQNWTTLLCRLRVDIWPLCSLVLFNIVVIIMSRWISSSIGKTSRWQVHVLSMWRWCTYLQYRYFVYLQRCKHGFCCFHCVLQVDW